MSLLSEAMEKCIYIDKTTASDGYGGVETVWKEGAEFDAAIVLKSSLERTIADRKDSTGVYSITTGKEINLQFHDVFKRASDGKVFRVTSDGDDNHTPASAGLNMRQVDAEEWVLT